MKKLLVTGGIGSGKSFVISLLNAMGIPSYDSDTRVKELYDEDRELLKKIEDIVGKDVEKDGKLDRKALAAFIFSDAVKREEVENAVYPVLKSDFDKWCSEQVTDVVIFESAIALEKPFFNNCFDKVAVVTAPVEVRIARAAKRDNTTRDDILSRMSSQWNDAHRLEFADFVIDNDNVAPLLPQIEQILKTL